MREWVKELLEKKKKMDPVDKDELKGTHADRKDGDIDNDGDEDESDKYLHNRRKTIKKSMSKDEGYVSNAQRKAVWATRKDGGKGHPDAKKESVEEKNLTPKQIKRALASIKPSKKKPTLPQAPWDKKKNEAYNEPQGQAKRMMSPLQKMRMDKEKADRDRDGKLKPGVVKKEATSVDEISRTKLSKYASAAKQDIERKRNKVKAALDQPASVKHAKAGLKAMSGLTKRSRGSDMYVNKMTGRSKVKPTNEAAVDEVSKGMVGRYLKKVPASAAHAGDRTGTGGMGQAGASADVKKGYEKQRKKGIAQFVRRQKGTNMAVNKLTGKAKVPAREAYENIPAADKNRKGYQDPMGKGLAPNAKAQAAKKMPTPEPIDEPKVDAKNFKDFRKGLKASPKRKGDNPAGDKAPVK